MAGELTKTRALLANARSTLREVRRENDPMTEATVGTGEVVVGAVAGAVLDHVTHDRMVGPVPLSGIAAGLVIAAGVGAESRDLIRLGQGMIAPTVVKMTRVKLMTWSSGS